MVGYDVLVIGAKKNHVLKPYFERVCLLLNLMIIDFLFLKRGYFERVCLLLKFSRRERDVLQWREREKEIHIPFFGFRDKYGMT